MYLESLDFGHFRNLELGHLTFSPGFNVFYGDNAQGKSNLLEAIYTLAFLKGFRANKLSELIAFDASKAQLSTVVRNGHATTRLGLELDAHMRRAFVDGTPCCRVRDYLGVLRAILFVPMDVGFMQTAPTMRRSMLDRMIFNLHPSYLIDLEQYAKVCKQKSAVLRSEMPDQRLLDAYDEQLLPLGERILRARYEYFRLMTPYICEVFASIFDDDYICRPIYKCSNCRREVVFGDSDQMSLDDLTGAWRQYIQTCRAKELARQQITSGPQRDDWTLGLNGRQARFFASQGQQRAMSLALKLAEITCLKKEAGIEPVFLLDDVSSELDPVRHKKLFVHLNALTTQTFLTTTSKSHVYIECVGRIYHVSSGRIGEDESGN